MAKRSVAPIASSKAGVVLPFPRLVSSQPKQPDNSTVMTRLVASLKLSMPEPDGDKFAFRGEELGLVNRLMVNIRVCLTCGRLCRNVAGLNSHQRTHREVTP